MTSSPSRTVARRVTAFLTAFATLLVLGALAPTGALADVVQPVTISGDRHRRHGRPGRGDPVVVSPNQFAGTLVTDADGHYSAPDLVPGSYTRVLRPTGGQPAARRGVRRRSVPWSPTRITVGSADVTGIDAVLDRAASITGRVVDPDGNPIPGVGVQLRSAAFAYANVTTGTDGTYTAAGLRAGDWRIEFSAPHGSPWVAELYDDARTSDTQTVVPLAPGVVATLNDAVLARGGTISGRILAPDGTPRPGIEVFASTDAGTGGSGTTTDADGDVHDHRAGRRRLHRVRPVGLGRQPGRGRVPRDPAVAGRRAGARRRCCDRPARRHEHDPGRDDHRDGVGPDGAPLADANVRARRPPDGGNSAITGQRRLVLDQPAAAGHYLVSARRPPPCRSCGRSTPRRPA